MTDAIESTSTVEAADGETAFVPESNGDLNNGNAESSTSVPKFELVKVVRDFVQGTIEKEEALKRTYEKSQKDGDRFVQLLLEALVLVESSIKDDKESKERFVDFVKLFGSSVIPEDVLKADLPTYGDLDSSNLNPKSRYNKMRTKLYYKQTKFNLFREENEGFSKLIVDLLDQSYQQSSAEELDNRLLHLIGQFKIDPNRVANFVLDAFENCLEHREVFVSLLKRFQITPDNLIHHLAVKLRFYAKNGGTPFALYLVIAVLIDEEMVDMEKIIPHMTLNTNDLKIEIRDRFERTKKRAKKAETISTASIQLNSNGERDKSLDSMYTNDDSKASTGIPLSVATGIQEEHDLKLAAGDNDDLKTLGRNQRLGLLCALLEVRNWNCAQYLFNRFPEGYPVNASSRVARALSAIFFEAVEEFYNSKFKCEWTNPSSSKCTTQCVAGENTPPYKKRCFEVHDWSDLIEGLTPIYHNLGPLIACRTDAVFMLIRLFEVFFRERRNDESLCESTHSDGMLENVIDIIDEVILPALSLTDENCALSEEIWNLLSPLDYKHRYRMYGRWDAVHSVRFHGISIKKGKILGKTRYVLKRLSKDTVRVMGRLLGKLCHVHPTTVFDYILGQVQTFENLIEPVVDSLKYLTSLEFDILSFSIIKSLSEEGKNQLKASDGTFSPWLQALASFVGSVYKRYNIELTGLLFYVLHQLREKQSYDLIILREVMHSMSGIEVGTHLAAEQLEALCGGEMLRMESGSMTNVEMNKRALTRLRDALMKDDLITALCIMIAQQTNWIVYHESSEIPVKLTGGMLDKCQETLVQCGSFLWSNTTKTPAMPSAPELMAKYDLTPETAMFLSRPYYARQIQEKFEKSKNILMDIGEDKVEEKESSVVGTDKDMEYIMYKGAFDEVMNEVSDQLYKTFPEGFFSELTARLYVLFWLLSNYDISVPKKAYEREIEKLNKEIESFCENSDMKRERNQKEEKRLRELLQSLESELEDQTVHVNRIRAICKASKVELFSKGGSGIKENGGNQLLRFIQACIIPRAVCTEFDAMYCAMFIELIHSQGTAFFQTVVFYYKLIPDVLLILANLSENEANCYGKFLCCLLDGVIKWRDETLFNNEVLGSAGMCTRWKQYDQINYEAYKTITDNIFGRFSRSICNALTSQNYTLIRNALFVLTKVLPVFPFQMQHYNLIVERVHKLKERENESRRDLSLMAASYAGQLRKQMLKNIPNFEELITKQKAKEKEIAMEKEQSLKTNKRVVVVAESNAESVQKTKKSDEKQTQKASSSSPSGEEPVKQTAERKPKEKEVTKEKEKEPAVKRNKRVTEANSESVQRNKKSEEKPPQKASSNGPNGEETKQANERKLKEKEVTKEKEKEPAVKRNKRVVEPSAEVAQKNKKSDEKPLQKASSNGPNGEEQPMKQLTERKPKEKEVAKEKESAKEKEKEITKEKEQAAKRNKRVAESNSEGETLKKKRIDEKPAQKASSNSTRSSSTSSSTRRRDDRERDRRHNRR